MNDTNNQTDPNNQTPKIINTLEIDSSNKKSKKLGILITIFFIFLFLSGGLAYYFLIYIPNKPENIIKKAASNFINQKNSYTLTGKIDQGDTNAEDINFKLLTSTNGDSSAEISISNFIISPTLSFRSVTGLTYVSVNNLLGKLELAKQYTNSGKPALAENLADFADKSEIGSNLDKWLEIPSYLIESPVNNEGNNFKITQLKDLTPSIDAVETLNNNRVRKYNYSLSKDQFLGVLDQISSSSKLNPLTTVFKSFTDKNKMADNLQVSIWVNIKTKQIEQVKYNGRPFKDATLDLQVVKSENKIESPKSYSLYDALSYGFVDNILFNKDYQFGKTDADKERIADLKGIKTALEIFKAKNGYYPDRSSIAVGQANFVSKSMPGASLDIFKDPNSRFIGQNGGQYAYVPQNKDGKEDCSDKTCEKYFIITTLDDNTKYQLNSDN